MIQINGTHRANVLVLEIVYPGEKKVDFKSIAGESKEGREQQASEFVCAINKNYISEKICRWLKQRMFQIPDNDVVRSQQAAKLLVLVNYYNQFNYFKLCKLIAENRAAIESVAPGMKSQYYNYYKTVIVGILKHCEFMKGETGKKI
jgi:hypothetical protein